MKFKCEIAINRPVEEVVELFHDPDNLTKWMIGLQSFEHLSGEPGTAGASSKLHFKMGNREFDMIETLKEWNPPQRMCAELDGPGGSSTATHSFSPTESGGTKWVSESEFELKGFYMKLMGFLMPGAFRKQSMKYAVAFKEFAETEAAERGQ